jgi:hypothetical protein
MKFDTKELDGQWRSIILDFTGYTVPTKVNQPCPFCGGDDRFTYTNKHNNGTWLCRRCTPDASDGIGFIAKRMGRDRKEIFKQLVNRYQYDTPKQDVVEVKYESDFVKLDNGDTHWDGHTLRNKEKRYDFKYIWKWNNPDGSFYGHIARMEFFSKEKQEDVKIIWQIHYGHPADEPDAIGWYQIAVQPKPLFGYEQYAMDGIKRIIIVEGEKTCYAAKRLLNKRGAGVFKNLILCCQGGASQVNCTDWKPIIDSYLPVYIWPDLDEAGFDHARKIKQIITRAQIFQEKDLVFKLGLEEKQDAADLQELTQTQLEGLINNAR